LRHQVGTDRRTDHNLRNDDKKTKARKQAVKTVSSVERAMPSTPRRAHGRPRRPRPQAEYLDLLSDLKRSRRRGCHQEANLFIAADRIDLVRSEPGDPLRGAGSLTTSPPMIPGTTLSRSERNSGKQHWRVIARVRGSGARLFGQMSPRRSTSTFGGARPGPVSP